jgi:hypothetical protein
MAPVVARSERGTLSVRTKRHLAGVNYLARSASIILSGAIGVDHFALDAARCRAAGKAARRR